MTTHRLIATVILTALAACSGADSSPHVDQPFAGPGWDDQAKRPKDGSRRTFIAAATHLVVKPLPEAHTTFARVFLPIRQALQSAPPGFVGYATRVTLDLHEDFTISLWEDEESMLAFVTGPEHEDAMQSMAAWVEDGTVVQWEVTPEELPLTFELAQEKLGATGRDVY